VQVPNVTSGHRAAAIKARTGKIARLGRLAAAPECQLEQDRQDRSCHVKWSKVNAKDLVRCGED